MQEPKLGAIIPNMGIKRSGDQEKKKAARKSSPQRGLADALFTSTQRKVLGLLFGQPQRRFFAREMIGLAGGGSGAVQRELESLAESGLVHVERVGNLKYYQANPDSPVFEELHRIVLKTVGLAQPLRDVLQRFSTRIQLAFVYGSVAKGRDRASSDVDLLIVADGLPLEELYDALWSVEERIHRKISPVLYTPEEFRKRLTEENFFVQKILADEKLVLMGDVNAFGKT